MATTIDIVEGAQLDNAITAGTMTRIAYVNGLDAGAMRGDPTVLIRALGSGMPQFYDGHPADGTFLCNRHVIKPDSDSSCTITIYYYRGFAVLSSWLETESTSVINDTTTVHPGDGTFLATTLDITGTVQSPGSSSGPIDVKQVKRYFGPVSYARAIRKITFEGSVFGANIPGQNKPPIPIVFPGVSGRNSTPTKETFARAANSVNATPWRGYDIGYWWFNEWVIASPDWGVTSAVRASMVCKMTEDWSVYQINRDTANGKMIIPRLDFSNINSLKSLPYEYGVNSGTYTYQQTNADGSFSNVTSSNTGIIKIGFYPLVDFFTLFGS